MRGGLLSTSLQALTDRVIRLYREAGSVACLLKGWRDRPTSPCWQAVSAGVNCGGGDYQSCCWRSQLSSLHVLHA